MTVEPWKIGSTCRLVFGDATPGRFKRSLVRADLGRIGFRTTYLCPSGFEIQTGIITCTPITTVQAAVFVLTAQGTCDAATIQSVKDAITNFLSDETSAFGEFAAGMLCCSGPDAYCSGSHAIPTHRLQFSLAAQQAVTYLLNSERDIQCTTLTCGALCPSAGVYVPKLVVKVSCISIQTTQVRNACTPGIGHKLQDHWALDQNCAATLHCTSTLNLDPFSAGVCM
jgi:hypothetical protein